jgi:hypothetical protein
MNVRYRVELSQSERAELGSLLSGGKDGVRKLKRAQVLLAADAGARATRRSLAGMPDGRLGDNAPRACQTKPADARPQAAASRRMVPTTKRGRDSLHDIHVCYHRAGRNPIRDGLRCSFSYSPDQRYGSSSMCRGQKPRRRGRP